MANPNSPFGFQIMKTEGKENRITPYNKTAAQIYEGDALTMVAAGQVQVAVPGDVICGVAAESAKPTALTIAVYDDPNAEFMVQTSGVFALADVGQNADIAAGAVPNVALSRSGQQIDTASQDVTATLQFKILSIVQRLQNAVGANALITVKPNNHLKSNGVAGI